MKVPPLFATVGIRGFKFWVPIFILWLLLAPLVVLALAIALIAAVIVNPADGPSRLWKVLVGIYELFCESRGIRVDVEQVSVSLY